MNRECAGGGAEHARPTKRSRSQHVSGAPRERERERERQREREREAEREREREREREMHRRTEGNRDEGASAEGREETIRSRNWWCRLKENCTPKL